MTRVVLMVMVCLVLANCGVRRPLMKPNEIPAYQEKMRKQREQLLQEEDAATAPARAQKEAN